MSRLRPWMVAAAVVIAGFAVLAVVSLHDEELTPEARALFAKAKPRVFSRESGWALLSGFTAPAGHDPRDYAQLRRRTVTANTAGLSFPIPKTDELALRAADELLCAPESKDCVRAFAVRPDSIQAAAADNSILLARFDELLRARDLGATSELLRYNTLYAPADVVLQVQKLRMSQVGVATARGRIDQALAWLEADATFHRSWLGDSTEMLSTALAARGLTRSFLMAGQIARAAHALTPGQRQALERIIAPLTASQWSVATAIRSEAAGLAVLVDDMIASPRKTGAFLGASPFLAEVAGWTMRRNATLNFAVPHYASWARLDALPTDSLAPAIEELRAASRQHLARDWTWAYNFAGRSIVAEESFDASDFAYRLRDVDALARLIRCAVGLRANAIAVASAAAFVSSDPACLDPYLSRPFAWDAGRGELSFKPGFAGNVDRLGGGNGRVAFAPYPR